MSRLITFSRNLNIEWLDFAADCRLMGKTKEEAAEAINQLVSRRIVSKDNIRKTRTLLLSIWYDNDPWFLSLAEKTCRDLPRHQWLPVHWSLMLLKFPIFHDVCDRAGKLLDYKESITIAQIQQQVFEKWGARNTMLHTLPKIVQTLKDIQALKPGNAKGDYTACSYEVDSTDAVTLLVAALLACKEDPHLTWGAVIHDPAIFPFEIVRVSQADIAACDRIELARSGDEVVLGLR